MGITHLSGLEVSGTTTLSGVVSTVVPTTLAVTGTVTAGGPITATGAITSVGELTGSKLTLTSGSVAGKRTIATAGSATISTNQVHTASVILISPEQTNTRKIATVVTRTAGTSFKIKLALAGGGTAATGAINWMIINTS
jgi:hypothetical protein